MKLVFIIPIALFFQTLSSVAATYPFPSTTNRSGGVAVVQPIYGQDHLASHAHAIQIDDQANDITIEFSSDGKPSRILGEKYEGDTVHIHWNGDQIVSVDLGLISTAPRMSGVTDATFLKFIQELLDERVGQIHSSILNNSTWKGFIENIIGPLKSSYTPDQLVDLINNNFEIRMRFKVVRPELMSKIGIRQASSDPFKVKATEQQGATSSVNDPKSISLLELLTTLEEQPIPECERLLTGLPLFL